MTKFLLFLYLFANSYCIIQENEHYLLITSNETNETNTTNITDNYVIQKIKYNSMTKLNTTNMTKYFYIETKNFKESVYIYLYFKDEGYKLDKKNLKYCFTSNSPDEELSCIFDDLDGPFGTLKKKHYFYKISYDDDGYLIIYYNGKNPNGSLKVQCASDNLYDIIKESFNTALSILEIIGIVFASLCGLACLCGITACLVEIICGKKTTSESIEDKKPEEDKEDNKEDNKKDNKEDKDQSLLPLDSE